jgi:small basic protein
VPKIGHSPFGVASVCMAVAVYLFTIAAGFFGITPFESMGDQKEIKVAVMAAILGILLAIRGMQDSRYKQLLAVVGLVLNGLAIPAALFLLPCL